MASVDFGETPLGSPSCRWKDMERYGLYQKYPKIHIFFFLLHKSHVDSVGRTGPHPTYPLKPGHPPIPGRKRYTKSQVLGLTCCLTLAAVLLQLFPHFNPDPFDLWLNDIKMSVWMMICTCSHRHNAGDESLEDLEQDLEVFRRWFRWGWNGNLGFIHHELATYYDVWYSPIVTTIKWFNIVDTAT